MDNMAHIDQAVPPDPPAGFPAKKGHGDIGHNLLARAARAGTAELLQEGVAETVHDQGIVHRRLRLRDLSHLFVHALIGCIE